MMVYVYEYFTKFVAGVMSCWSCRLLWIDWGGGGWSVHPVGLGSVGPVQLDWDRIGVSIPSPNFQSSVVVTFPSPGKFQNLSMSVTRVALVSERVDA